MSFGDHLDELRKRILLAIAAPLPIAIILFFLSNTLIEFLLLPVTRVLRAHGLPEQLQVLSPIETIVMQMKLSLIFAVVLCAPWIFWQVWKFIEPGLHGHEKRFVRLLIPFSAILMLSGVALLYFVMLPLMLNVLVAVGSSIHMPAPPPPPPAVAALLAQHPVLHIATETPPNPVAGEVWLTWPEMQLYVAATDEAGSVQVVKVASQSASAIRQEYRLSDYIGLVLMLMLGIAIAFQMPLVIVMLGWLGIASPQWLRKKRKYALLVCAIVAVIITPPDVISMLIMLIPLYGLYELGILLLVIAPASAVSQGRVFSWRRIWKKSSDNGREPLDQVREPSQTEPTQTRQTRQKEYVAKDADGGEENL